jgi:hypothetical protein
MRQFSPAIEHVSVRSLKGPTRVTRDVIARLRSKQIAASIERFGFSTPVLIADDDEIVAGQDASPQRRPALATSGKRIDPSRVRIDKLDAGSASGHGGGGRYIPDWERLLDAVKRVMATGMKEGEAKLDLCRAISDRKIKIRFLVEKEEGCGPFGEIVVGTVRQGSDVDIPSHLDPRDFDWLQSRPRKPWRDTRERFLPSDWWFEWIEVSRDGVTRVLCGAESGHESPEGHGAREPPQRGRGKSQPARERARGVIKELYPDGVPGQATEPNAHLCRRVSAKLKEAKLPDVSDDTILRVAGRRK